MVPTNKHILTGDPELDSEHTQILSTLNRLHEPMVTLPQRIAICEKLLHYIDDHIVLEEYLMNMYGYPYRAEHQNSHILVQKEFIVALSAFLRGHAETISNVYDTFVFHIIDFDIPMATFIKAAMEKERQEDL